MPDNNKIKYGIKNVHYAVATIAADGSATYATPKPLPGGVSVSLAAQGDTNIFYADNIAYYTSVSNNGYQGDLELARVTDDFGTDVLGNAAGANGLKYEDANAPVVHFALLFQFEGDVSARRHVMYNCTAQRPDVASQTKGESIEPQTETLSLTATTIYIPGLDKDVPKAFADEGDAAYADFFTAVTFPTVAGGGGG